LPSFWASLTPILIISWLAALLPSGGPLLGAWLRHRPITRRAWLHAASDFVAAGTMFTVTGALNEAYNRELLSLIGSLLVGGLALLIVAGSTTLLTRRFPLHEEER